ncbi:hypothetical protein D7Y41_14980 [Anaerotruncus sp. 1XD22-93]|nr:hypothetical protein [Anaerotruncus sp. 1XD42-93]RKJ92402.1 hypothetical protein D7Y41_14980 [Anaerotruncus sp. 1XD22-93]
MIGMLLFLEFQKNNCLSGQYNTACKRCQKVFSVLAARLAVWWQEEGYGGERGCETGAWRIKVGRLQTETVHACTWTV